jgi:predicted small secreted protein
MRLALVTLALIVCGFMLSACGSSTRVSIARGVIHLGRAVPESSLHKSVLGIKRGTDAATVHSRLGQPFAAPRARGLTCLAYRAEQSGSAIDALDFCIDADHRVQRILVGVHG